MNGRSFTRAAVVAPEFVRVVHKAPPAPESLPLKLPKKRKHPRIVDIRDGECVVLPAGAHALAVVKGVVYYHLDGDLAIRRMEFKR